MPPTTKTRLILFTRCCYSLHDIGYILYGPCHQIITAVLKKVRKMFTAKTYQSNEGLTTKQFFHIFAYSWNTDGNERQLRDLNTLSKELSH